jgi:hypothetical protein
MTLGMFSIPAWAVIAGDTLRALRNSKGPQRDDGRTGLTALLFAAAMAGVPRGWPTRL